METRRPRRVAPALLLVMVLLSGIVVPPSPAAAAGGTGSDAGGGGAAPMRVPVVLVHGLRGNAASTWGAPADEGQQPKGTYLALCREGYEPGRTLFACDYGEDSLGDFRTIAGKYLAPAVDEALARSGCEKVDLVARSMGGLVARALLADPAYRDKVRTLVMICTPNRGSFGANIVRAAEMISLQEQLRHRGADHEVPLERPDLPTGAGLVAPFEDEVSYVARQSGSVWEPVFGHYYVTAWLLAERSGGGRAAPPEFFVWLEEQFPQIYRTLLVEAQYPPVAPSYFVGAEASFQPGMPGPGESLTRAYYDLLAVQAARHNFFVALRTEPADAPLVLSPRGLLDRLLGVAQRFLLDKLGQWARRKGQGLLVWGIDQLAGLDPKSRATECLVEERTALSVGGPLTAGGGELRQLTSRLMQPIRGGAGPSSQTVLANYYLERWNDDEETARALAQDFAFVAGDAALPEGVRYVSIAGQVPNVWAAWWPDVGPNDLIVETSSTFLPLGENDVYGLYPSLLSSNHVWLAGSGKPYQALIDALRHYYPVRQSYKPPYQPGRSRLVDYTRRGEGQAEVYRPYYLELGLPAAGQARVELGVEGATEVLAWAYLELGGQGLYRYPLAFGPADALGRRQAQLELQCPAGGGDAGSRLLVGIRLAAEGDPAQGPPPNTRQAFSWELGFAPAQEDLGLSGPVVVGQALKPGPQAGPPAAAAGPAAPAGPQGPAAPASAPPVIHATHRDKETVSLEPSFVSHARWDWDFGDGARLSEADPGHTTYNAEHAYTSPGTYVCRAVSTGTDGRELASWEWTVELKGPEPMQRSFTAHTLAVPEVNLALKGPIAWVVGRPADYALEHAIRGRAGEGTKAEVAYLYPAPKFQMVWEKPGRFVVKGAMALRLTYPSGHGLASVVNVYTVQRDVQVYATVITD